jgi:N-methylhydantoinase A
MGGDQPTVTDAALLLNRFVEGRGFGSVSQIEPDRALAEEAIQRHIARPLGISTREAAEAIVATAAVLMASGVRAMSVGRGLDPREATLMVGGGAGPQFASHFAAEVGVRRLLFPRHPGVINALGCAVTDLRQDYTRTVNAVLREENLAVVGDTIEDQNRQAREFAESVGVDPNGATYAIEAEMQYEGQTHTFTVPFDAGGLTVDGLLRGFHAEYSKWHGRVLDDVEVNVRSVRTTVIAERHRRPGNNDPRPAGPRRPAVPSGKQMVVHEADEVFAQVYEGEALRAGDELDGPALIGQVDSSVWLPPGATALVDANRNLRAELPE